MKQDNLNQHLYDIVAKVLKSKMKAQNLSINKLSKLSGISNKTISNLLKARSKNVRMSTILPLFDILNISTDKDIIIPLNKENKFTIKNCK